MLTRKLTIRSLDERKKSTYNAHRFDY